MPTVKDFEANHLALRAWILLAGALLSCGATGCASGLFGAYNSQGCAETSLRSHPGDPLSADAVPFFREQCAADDGGACSALGVARELGIGGAQDVRSAATLYERACFLGNARGCTNLGALLARGANGKPDTAEAKRLFESSCKAGERSGCAALGRLYRDGHGVKADSLRAERLFDQACGDGEASACLDLANVLAVRAPEQALALYVRSCLAGYTRACSELESPIVPKAKDAPTMMVSAR
jgi:hypothetical protein